jgi:hypothetical protein
MHLLRGRLHRGRMTRSTSPVIVAAIREVPAGEPVRRAALERARREGAALVLYDLDAPPSPLESPRPTNWSADGAQEQLGDRLEPADLEAAGRADLARVVRAARDAGVEAWAWLPESDTAEALADYVARSGASAVVVAADDRALVGGVGTEAEVVGR